MNDFIRLEKRAGGTEAAYKLAGIARTSWYRYVSGARTPPKYIERSVEAHLLLSDRELKRLAKERGA